MSIQTEITRISDSVTAQAAKIEEIKSKLVAGLGYPLEDLIVPEGWAELFAALDDGTYATKYSVGDLIPLDLGDEGAINMQIVAFDADDLADGSGKAKVSLISKELPNTRHRMNPFCSGDSTSGYVEGTGAIGGWEKSEMRSYMKETLKPLIPEAVRSRIATVTKTQPAYDTMGTSVTQTTQDDVWISSYDELYSSTGLYHSVFPDNASRIKRILGYTFDMVWWLRSVENTGRFLCVYDDGTQVVGVADSSFGVALGFCLS